MCAKIKVRVLSESHWNVVSNERHKDSTTERTVVGVPPTGPPPRDQTTHWNHRSQWYLASCERSKYCCNDSIRILQRWLNLRKEIHMMKDMWFSFPLKLVLWYWNWKHLLIVVLPLTEQAELQCTCQTLKVSNIHLLIYLYNIQLMHLFKALRCDNRRRPITLTV